MRSQKLKSNTGGSATSAGCVTQLINDEMDLMHQ